MRAILLPKAKSKLEKPRLTELIATAMVLTSFTPSSCCQPVRVTVGIDAVVGAEY